MGSDRLRRSYDEERRYQRIVPQQGRPSVEADPNEQQEISTEETRKLALSVVGPSGTPDDGYAIDASLAPDFSVGAGTMYVGGIRVSLADPVTYGDQPEWLDGPIPSIEDLEGDGNELVVLTLVEQEVSAVEDTALREVALGGPDTGQRTRILQRFERFDVGDATTCEDADAVAEAKFADARGYRYDPETKRLWSKARLLVDYDLGTSGNACKPAAEQGYLGAENQLLRVQISSDPGDDPKLLWAFEDASALYRVTKATPSPNAGTTTIEISPPPVDAHHEPRVGQRIELLRSTMRLESPDDFIAAHAGVVVKIAKSYDPETQSLTVEGVFGSIQSIDREKDDPEAPPPVFARVWEDEIAFTPRVPTPLGDTGVRVTIGTLFVEDALDRDVIEATPAAISAPSIALAPSEGHGGEGWLIAAPIGDEGPTPIHLLQTVLAKGDYWLIGVRPRAPLDVLPNRYLKAPQLPDGPRRWALPLSVIQAFNQQGYVVADCRDHFRDLVELHRRKGCAIVIDPAAVAGGEGLQALIDGAAQGAPVTIEMAPGDYLLDHPLTLRKTHRGLTLRACGKGVKIAARPGREDRFLRGLVELAHAQGVTLEGISFEVPSGPLLESPRSPTGTLFSVGIRPMSSPDLTIDGCTFDFAAPPLRATGIAVAVLAGGVCDGLVFRRSTVRGTANLATFGVAMAPTVTLDADTSGRSPVYTGGSVIEAALREGTICDNVFDRVSAPIFLFASAGALRVDRNRVIDATIGISILSIASLSMDSTSMLSLLREALAGVPNGASALGLLNFFRTTLRTQAASIGLYPAPPNVALGAVDVPPFAAPVTNVNLAYAMVAGALELSGQKPPVSAPLALHLTRNDIAVSAASPFFGFVVWDTRADRLSPLSDGAAIVGRNHVSMTGGIAGGVVAMVERCAVTGNVIASQPSPDNPSFHPFGLVVVRGLHVPPPAPMTTAGPVIYARAAVTGNVCQGPSISPLRPPAIEPSLPWANLNHNEP